MWISVMRLAFCSPAFWMARSRMPWVAYSSCMLDPVGATVPPALQVRASRSPRRGGDVSASGWSVSRILSGESHRFTPEGFIPGIRFSDHLSRRSTRDLTSPKGGKERAAPSSLFDLALDGGCLAARIAADAGGLLHHLFTITGRFPAVIFCGPIRQITPSRDFPGAVPCRVRTFLDHAEARPRSPNRPEAVSSYTGAGGASTLISGLFNVK